MGQNDSNTYKQLLAFCILDIKVTLSPLFRFNELFKSCRNHILVVTLSITVHANESKEF